MYVKGIINLAYMCVDLVVKQWLSSHWRVSNFSVHKITCLSNPNLLLIAWGILDNHYSSLHTERLNILGCTVNKDDISSYRSNDGVDVLTSNRCRQAEEKQELFPQTSYIWVTHFGESSSPSVNPSRKFSDLLAQNFVSWLIPNLIKLTTYLNYHIYTLFLYTYSPRSFPFLC